MAFLCGGFAGMAFTQKISLFKMYRSKFFETFL
ncbi:MAG: hypothetical protein DID92_2727743209 [Candidatus Nitrotoga sp. SPKER]|nr:MAG: hypothetical protein DID92_2727743209 [Candidatus Nitrotoga sp. SPKER]